MIVFVIAVVVVIIVVFVVIVTWMVVRVRFINMIRGQTPALLFLLKLLVILRPNSNNASFHIVLHKPILVPQPMLQSIPIPFCVTRAVNHLLNDIASFT